MTDIHDPWSPLICRAMADTVPVSVIVTDAAGTIVDVNAYHLAQIGRGEVPREAYVGSYLPKHPSVVAAGLQARYEAVLAGDDLVAEDEYFPSLSGGGSARLSVYGRPVLRDGEIVGAVFVHQDVSERSRYQSALDETKEELRQANAELQAKVRQLMDTESFVVESEKLVTLGRLIAVTAHETNNALMGIQNYVEYAQSKSDNERVAGYLQKADREIKRISRVMREMLAYGRGSNDVFQAVDLAAVLDRAQGILGPELYRAGVELTVDIADDLPRLWANEDALEQVLINLLTNARDAVAGGAEPTIRVAARLDDGRILISVRDNGPGIDEDVAERIFEPFVTTKPKGKGTGLGLPICKRLVDGLGGEIRAVSPEDGGTAMEIRLPVDRSEEEDRVAAEVAATAEDGV